MTAPETKAEATAPAAEQDKPSAVEKAAEQRKQPEEKQTFDRLLEMAEKFAAKHE